MNDSVNTGKANNGDKNAEAKSDEYADCQKCEEPSEKPCGHLGEKLSAFIDGELTQQESQQVQVHLEDCTQCQLMYEQLMSVKTAMGSLTMPELEIDRIEKIMNEPIAKTSQTLGWTAFIIGLAILAVYLITSFYIDDSISSGEKWLVSLLGGGVLGIFASVARQQWLARKTDKYKGVKL